MRPPVYKYFATDREGRIQPITPIDEPIGSQTEVSNWVAGAVVKAYTFDFANWRAQLSAARNDFTPQGWKGFEAALKDSGVLQTVLEKKYVTTAVPTGAPVMINQGVVDGHYAWKFQMPILVTYQSSERTVPQNLMVNVLVVRQSEMENPRGLGIAQLIAQ
jgi:intracellular multiplication protein IcmL